MHSGATLRGALSPVVLLRSSRITAEGESQFQESPCTGASATVTFDPCGSTCSRQPRVSIHVCRAIAFRHLVSRHGSTRGDMVVLAW